MTPLSQWPVFVRKISDLFITLFSLFEGNTKQRTEYVAEKKETLASPPEMTSPSHIIIR